MGLWSTCDPRPFLRLVSLLDPLVQRLQNSGVDCRNHVHSRIELFFGHPCFPCVRKAPVHSRIAKPHHRYGQTHKHFLTFRQAFDGMSVAVEGSKVGFLHGQSPLLRESIRPRSPFQSLCRSKTLKNRLSEGSRGTFDATL
jgi:hypothetical protein